MNAVTCQKCGRRFVTLKDCKKHIDNYHGGYNPEDIDIEDL